jgi:hypothetical protein
VRAPPDLRPLADLASATVLRRSTVGMALAKLEGVGMVRRSTGWDEGADRRHRSSVGAEQADAEPATRCRAAAGRRARRLCSTPCVEPPPTAAPPDRLLSYLADRAGLKIPPDGAAATKGQV